MVITLLLEELGGTPLENRGDKTHISEEETQTWQGLVKQSINIAENAVRTLQSNNVFTNGPNLVADEMTDATGTKNTINTTDTTAEYDSVNSYYILGPGTDLISAETTHDPDTFTNPTNAFDSDDDTFAIKQTEITTGSGTLNHELGKTFTIKNIKWVRIKVNAFADNGFSVANCTCKLQKFTSSTWSDVVTLFSGTISNTTLSYDDNYFLDEDVEGLRISFSTNYTHSNAAPDIYHRVFTLEGSQYSTSSTVIADINTAYIDGNELGFAISVPDSASLYTGTGDGSDIDDSHGVTLGNTSSTSNKQGMKIYCKNDCILTEYTKSTLSTATLAYLYDENFNLIESTSFVSDVATFTGGNVLKANRYYYVLVDNDGNSYTYTTDSLSFPYSGASPGTNINWITGSDNFVDDINNMHSILTVTTQLSSTEITTPMSISATISDGTNSLTPKVIDDISKGCVIGNPGTLSSGILKCTFTLSTTDTTKTPILPSWACCILR